MKKIIAWVLLTVMVSTGCAPATAQPPGVTYGPPSRGIALPSVITPAKEPSIIESNNYKPTFTVADPRTHIIITSNATTTVTSPAQVSTTPTVANALVQVWAADSPNATKRLVSYGLTVGDGSQIITFFDYKHFTPPGSIEILAQNQFRYSANIQAIDPPTGLTLLKLNSTDRLPAVALSSPVLPESAVRVWGWVGSGVGFVNATMSNFSDSLFFSVSYDWQLNQPGPMINSPGAVVTDVNGKVLGFETTVHSDMGLTVPGRSPRLLAPAANVRRAIELLSPATVNRETANGPALITYQYKSGNGLRGGLIQTLSQYNEIAKASSDLLGTLGGNLTANDPIPTYISNLDGTTLLLVYPKPIELKSTDGKLLAQAKWIAIQWGRANGQPNRLLYGSTPYITQGGFVIQGNITALQQAIQ